MGLSKRPKNRRACETAGDVGVVINVGVVVIIDEIITERLAEDDPGKADQGDADHEQGRAGGAQCFSRPATRFRPPSVLGFHLATKYEKRSAAEEMRRLIMSSVVAMANHPLSQFAERRLPRQRSVAEMGVVQDG